MTASGAGAPRHGRRNIILLALAQAIPGAQMPMIFTIGGLAGLSLSPNPCLATLPISATVLGSMLAANPISALMQRHGRRAGFWAGSAGGALGAAISAFALWQQSFLLFLLGALLTGVLMSSQGFLRFAAADSASEAYRPKAISYVMGGGLVAALLGPQLTKVTSGLLPVDFLGAYLAIATLNLIGACLYACLDLPAPAPVAEGAPAGRSRRELWAVPRIRVAIIVGMVTYALMNLVMTSTPLAMVGCGFDPRQAADVVSTHVLAMYIPSFFTGALIQKFGAERVMAAGLAILLGAGMTGLAGVDLGNFFGALVLLGLGWNFGFIGATAMLASAQRPEERGRLQGMNDMLVFGGVTLASLASGGLTGCMGGSPQMGWMAVNLAMIPFLTLAGGAMIWLVLRPKAAV